MYAPRVTHPRTFLMMGSGEFEPWSEEVERAALEGRDGPVAIVPTASASEGDAVFDRWGQMGLDHYAAMGIEASVVPIKTRIDAESEDLARRLDGASMIFFSGGKPRFLSSVIAGTRCFDALLAAVDRGSVYAGCSAGAMVASRPPDGKPKIGQAWVSGLGLLPHLSLGVHWDRTKYIPGLRPFMMSRSDAAFVGIDERTAILGDGERWTVYGLGTVMVRMAGAATVHKAGASFTTPG
jgi:cyanophycinase-like exopeptidase